MFIKKELYNNAEDYKNKISKLKEDQDRLKAQVEEKRRKDDLEKEYREEIRRLEEENRQLEKELNPSSLRNSSIGADIEGFIDQLTNAKYPFSRSWKVNK